MTTELPSDRQPPGYGPYPQPHWYGPIPPAPPVGRRRPGRVWIVLTWVLCTVVTATAMAWGLSTVQSAFSAAVPTRTAADGEAIVVDLDPADAPAIYVGIDAPGVGFEISYPHSSPVDAECVLRGDAEDTAIAYPERTFTLTTDGVKWHQLFLIHVPAPGAYELRCTGESARFGVGKDLPDGLYNRIMGLLAAALAVPAAAVVTTIVLVRKRRAY